MTEQKAEFKAQNDDIMPIMFRHQYMFENSVGILSKLPDNAITSKEAYTQDYTTKKIRINSEGYYASKSIDDYIVIDLMESYIVTGIEMTAGGNGIEYITKYRIETSMNGFDWKRLGIFKGCFGGTTVVKRPFIVAVRAVFVKFIPLEFIKHPCIQMDILVYKK